MSETTPTVHEAQHISVYMRAFSDKLEKLDEKVDTIKDSVADIKERVAKIESDTNHTKNDINYTQEYLKNLTDKVEKIPPLEQWSKDFQKKCDDIQSGHQKKHEIMKQELVDSVKNNEKMHDETKKDSHNKNGYIISITAIILSLVSIFLK